MKYAFLFDMDGVIVDTNPTHKIALREFCEKYGHHLDETRLKEHIYGRPNKDWIPAVFGPLDAATIARYGEEKEEIFRAMYEPIIRPLPGLVSFLDRLKSAGFPCAIATSAPRSNVDFVLKHTGIASFFQAILDESFVTRGKPDPEIYLKTAGALGFAPANCIVFEDSLSGIRSGKAAGCAVVGITTTHPGHEMAEADLVLDDFSDLEPERLISSLF